MADSVFVVLGSEGYAVYVNGHRISGKRNPPNGSMVVAEWNDVRREDIEIAFSSALTGDDFAMRKR